MSVDLPSGHLEWAGGLRWVLSAQRGQPPRHRGRSLILQPGTASEWTVGLGLPLGVLFCFAGADEAVLLAFFLAGVAGQEARLFEDRPQLGIGDDQCPGDAVL